MVSQRLTWGGTMYKLIIMDLKLPAIDGFETSTAIRTYIDEGIEESG